MDYAAFVVVCCMSGRHLPGCISFVITCSSFKPAQPILLAPGSSPPRAQEVMLSSTSSKIPDAETKPCREMVLSACAIFSILGSVDQMR